MRSDFIRSYANFAHSHIEKNVEFLESKDGDLLLKKMEEFSETWAEAEELVYDVLKDNDYNSAMYYIVDFIYAPSLFPVMFNILVSDVDGVIRTIRFLLEELELGLILDCSDEFRNLDLIEKLDEAIKLKPYDLIEKLEKILQNNDILNKLREFYGMLSSKWIHAPHYLDKLLQDSLSKGNISPKALYFPPLNEREDEVNELIEILDKFNECVRILVKEWKEKYLNNK
jgi:hypothetical protein